MVVSEIVLYADNCNPRRLAANRVMLATRNIFMLENCRDMFPWDFFETLQRSGSAGIVKE